MTNPAPTSSAIAAGHLPGAAARLAAGLLVLALGAMTPVQATVSLFDWGFNIDGTLYESFPATHSAPGQGGAAVLPPAIDVSGFDFSAGGLLGSAGGLGVIQVTLGGAGAHAVGVFLDHEIDETLNTLFNETGAAVGAPQSGQSWEIDKGGSNSPPFGYESDLIDNFFLPLNPGNLPELDNMAFFDAVAGQSLAAATGGAADGPVDVAMAMAWDFMLADGETAIIDFIVSEMQPAMGFYLQHSDPDSDRSIYFYSSLRIVDAAAVPAPAPLLLLGLGLVGFAARRRLRR